MACNVQYTDSFACTWLLIKFWINLKIDDFQWTLLPPFWPLNFLSSVFLIRYGSHFLCLATFHYTPNYSHSRLSPLHFLFPFSSLISTLSFQVTHLFPSAGHLLYMHPILTVLVFGQGYESVTITDNLSMQGRKHSSMSCEHVHIQYALVQRPEVCEEPVVIKCAWMKQTWCHVRLCERANH